MSVLKTAHILQSGMVIQQGKPFKLWGTGLPSDRLVIDVDWQINNKNVTVDLNGKWWCEIAVPTITPGDFSTHTITITNAKERIILNDLLIGEIWIAGGQSNMQFRMICEENREDGVLDFENEIKNAYYPNIRLFYSALNFSFEPFDELYGNWVQCSPASITHFSGVAYFYAKGLFLHLNIPIGIVLVTIGAALAQTWVSREVLKSDPLLYFSYLKPFDDSDLSKEPLNAEFTWEKVTRPTLLYNAMICPLFNLSIRGFIWYNGELNRNDKGLYTKLLTAMITDWRKKFNQGDLPFYFVQQASYCWENDDDESYNYALFREAQANSRFLNNTEMAVLIDEPDLTKLHPRNKQLVAKRLANIALKKIYRLQDKYFLGPQPKKIKITNHGAIISYKRNSIAKGLCTSDLIEPNNFFISGNNRQFYAATAEIKLNKIILYCPEVDKAVAVRYAFTNKAVTNLINTAGLPAEPFRTDNWSPPKIITIANIKGGVGKSTLALNLADYFKLKYKTALIDTSANGSITDLKKQEPPIEIFLENNATRIKKFSNEIIVIDTPPSFVGLEEILQISDFVLVPTNSNLFDAMAIEHIAEFIRLVQTRFAIKSGIVMNKVKNLSGDTAEVRKYLKSLPIRLMDSMVGDRVSFAKSPIVFGISETGDLKALKEIELLGEEIMKIINN